MTRLADGRELFYFDDTTAGTATGTAADVESGAETAAGIDRASFPDLRRLTAAAPSSTMRFDPLLDEWVTIAGHRQTRTHLPPDDECPLCPSRDGHKSEIPAPDYDVVVFENRFPSFAATSVAKSVDGHVDDPLFAVAPGLGRCEVVCFTADHDAAFSSLTPSRARTVIEAWVDRTVALSELPAVEQVFCFENRGEEIGVTLSHPHGQIYGYPFVTPRTRRMLDSARTYRQHTGRNLFADILERELQTGTRVVVRGRHWTAFVPFAAHWPLEVHVYPNRQVPDLPSLSDDERSELATIYLEVLRRMERVHADSLPYIAAWHQSPTRIDRELAYLHLEVFSIRRAPGKLKYLAGSESAMGAFVNDVLPEQAARMLRDVVL
jgi:UDPglucose--hexose-1-phosphate uridylyltransferase